MQKYTIKTSLVTIVLLSIIACKTVQIEKEIQVSEVKHLVTFPGVAGSPISNSIFANVVFKKSSKISFDSFWINGYVSKVFLMSGNTVLANNTTVEKDQVYQIRGSYYETTSTLENGEPDFNASSQKRLAPIKSKSPLILKVYKNNKVNYLQIDNIEKVEPVYGE